MTKEKILILGATGMIGNTLFRKLSQNKRFDVAGTTRKNTKEGLIPNINIENLINRTIVRMRENI